MNNITIFMFHDIRNPPFQFPERYNLRSFLRVKSFIERLNFIQKNYNIVSISELLRENNNLLGKNAVLSYDDGLLDHFSIVYPILKERKIPAVFFIPSSCIRTQELMDSHKIQFIIASSSPKIIVDEILSTLTIETRKDIYKKLSISLYKNNWWTPDEIFVTRFLRSNTCPGLIDKLYKKYVIFSSPAEPGLACGQSLCDKDTLKEQLYMTFDQVKELHENKFTIGGHGHYSLDLRYISPEQQIQEISESKKFLEEIGVKEFFFSYPNGGYTENVQALLKKYGFQAAVITGEKIVEFPIQNRYLIPRIDGAQYTFSPKIVLCGVQQQGIEIIEFLAKNGIAVTHVVTISEQEATRQKASGWVDYKKYSCTQNIEIYHAKHYGFKTSEDYEYFQVNRFDVLILGGWQRLIPGSILRTIKFGGIGQHGSSDFLPKYRGRSPLNWSIILGRKRLVWHLFSMTAGVDSGDILDYEIFDINEWDTCETMYFKVAIAVKNMYIRTIPALIEGTIKPRVQIGEPSFYGKRTPEDGKINWNSSVYEIHRLVRGVTRPYPGAFTMKKEEKIIVWVAQPFSQHLPFYIEKQYGEIVEVFSPEKFLVKAEEGLLLVTDSTDRQPVVGDVYI